MLIHSWVQSGIEPRPFAVTAGSPNHWKVKMKLLQSCPTLHDPMNCSLPGSFVHGFSRQEYWSGLPFSSPRLYLMNVTIFPINSHVIFPLPFEVKWKLLSCVQLFSDPRDCSLPDSSVHGLSQQEYWSGLPLPPPGNLLHPRMKPVSPSVPALADGLFYHLATWQTPISHISWLKE